MIQILTNYEQPSTVSRDILDKSVEPLTNPVVLTQFRDLGIPLSDLVGFSLKDDLIRISVFSGWGSGVIMFRDTELPEVLGTDLTELAWQIDNSGILQDVQKACDAVENRLSLDWRQIPASEVPDGTQFVRRDSLFSGDLSFFSLEKHLGRKPTELMPNGPDYYIKRNGDAGTSNTYICIRRGLGITPGSEEDRIVIETAGDKFDGFGLLSNLIRHKYVFDRYGIKATSS